MLFNLATGLVAGALSVASSIIIRPLEEILRIFTVEHECAHLMKVDGVSLLSKHDIERCESSVFDDYGYKWKLVFIPRGQSNPNNISLYLEMDQDLPANRVVNVDLQFFVVSHCGSKSLQPKWYGLSFSSSNSSYGMNSWISFEQLVRQGYLANDSLILGFEITNVQQWNPYTTLRPVRTGERLRLIERPQNGKFTWKITKFSTFNQAIHFSNEVVIGQRKWSIQIRPKGVKDGEGNSMSVFLMGLDYIEKAARAKTLVKYKMRVLNQLNGAHVEHYFVYLFGQPGDGYGKPQFLPLKDLYNRAKGFLVKDVIYIGVEFLLMSVTEVF